MAKKSKDESAGEVAEAKAAPGNLIQTRRYGEIIFAVVTSVDEVIHAIPVSGTEFAVEGEFEVQ
jgi:hypothetical protein